MSARAGRAGKYENREGGLPSTTRHHTRLRLLISRLYLHTSRGESTNRHVADPPWLAPLAPLRTPAEGTRRRRARSAGCAQSGGASAVRRGGCWLGCVGGGAGASVSERRGEGEGFGAAKSRARRRTCEEARRTRRESCRWDNTCCALINWPASEATANEVRSERRGARMVSCRPRGGSSGANATHE